MNGFFALLLFVFSGLATGATTSVKPPALSAILNSQLQNNDLILVYDVSAGITKKMTVAEADARYLSAGGSGSGSVTSVGMTVPSDLLSVTGSPITGAGTIVVGLPSRAANSVFAGPASGGSDTPGFRALVEADIPNISATKITSGTLPIARGGTNSATSLNNNRVMKSSGSAIVEADAITASRALVSDGSGIPTHSATTAAELENVNGVTSPIQTQLNAKQASGNYVTSLTGEVTASGPGASAATVTNSAVIGKVLTGYTSGAGTVAATDTILQAVQKLNGNTAAKGDVSSNVSSSTDSFLPIFSGTGGKTLTSQSILSYEDSFKALQINNTSDANNFARFFVPDANSLRIVGGGAVFKYNFFTGASTAGTQLNLFGPSSSHVWSHHLMGTGSGAAGEYRLYKDDGTPVLISNGSNIYLGQPSPATTATTGFTYIPKMAGAPTGVPTARTGFSAMVHDETNDKLCVYNNSDSAWQCTALTP